jgi:hypothetical protein
VAPFCISRMHTDTTEQDFNFWMPLEKANTSEKGDVRIIEGIASTPHLDLQGEKVFQKGIQFDYFLKHGYFNWDHKPGAENKIGEPWVCKITPEGLFVKGMIYKGKKVADAIWEHIQSLKSNPGSQRKVGFSLQGKTLLKKGQTLLKCWIQDIAITTAPINYNTYLDVVKSFSEYDLGKTLSAGSSVSGQTGGAALRPESGISTPTEEEIKDLGYAGGNRKITQKSLAGFIARNKGYSRKTSELLADILFDLSA